MSLGHKNEESPTWLRIYNQNKCIQITGQCKYKDTTEQWNNNTKHPVEE